MKYIKLFENIKEEEEIINDFKICFQELIDDELEVDIAKRNYNKIDFSK